MGMNIFEQFGFRAVKDAGDQKVGNCPVCGKPDHFYVFEERKCFDCKKCGASGGFQTFLETMVDVGVSFFKNAQAAAFVKHRGLKLATCKDAKLGYNPTTKKYLLPIYNAAGRLINVKHFKLQDKSFLGSVGCDMGLYGLERMGDAKILYLCEGEWDALAMREALVLSGLEEHAVLAVPGAGTFKAQWGPAFFDKRVYVMYDHDAAGEKGMQKVHTALSGRADLHYIHWPKDKAEGFDLRDFYHEVDNSDEFIRKVKSFCRSEPPGGVVDDPKKDDPTKAAVDPNAPRIPADEVYKAYQHWLHLPDTEVLDVLYGAILANRLQGDPVWLFLVAPPGATKTELLMSFFDAPNMTSTTSLTPHALVSGINLQTGDPSMIPKLNGKVLIIKDFTTILNLNQIAREEIFGILRDAYDGKTEKQFANGIFRSYNSKFGLVAGVTPAIEMFMEDSAALGERFLRWKVALPEDVTAFIKKAVSNSNNEVAMRKGLNDIAKEVLKYPYADVPDIAEDIVDKIVNLAQYTALMRGTVARDKYSKEVTHTPFSELGTRLAKQFVKLMCGIAMFRGLSEVTEAEYAIVQRIAVGTVPNKMDALISVIVNNYYDIPFEQRMIGEHTKLPNTTTGRVVENMVMLGILDRTRASSVQSEYKLTKKFKSILEKSGLKQIPKE